MHKPEHFSRVRFITIHYLPFAWNLSGSNLFYLYCIIAFSHTLIRYFIEVFAAEYDYEKLNCKKNTKHISELQNVYQRVQNRSLMKRHIVQNTNTGIKLEVK